MKSPQLRRAAVAAGLLIAAVSVLLVAAPTRAADPPHWAGAATTFDCTNSCHQGHSALGGALTSAAGNSNLCQSCHNAASLKAGDLPVNDADRADLSAETGIHHGWNRSRTNVAAGANGTITSSAMSARLNTSTATCPTGDCITCSTCHNQHEATSANGGLPRVGNAKPRAGNTSTGTVTSGGTFGGSDGLWYLVEAQGNTTFRWSKDGGTSWFGTGIAMSKGTPVALDNGVTVTFSTSGAFAASDRWEFNASWPFLRIPIDAGDNATGAKFCRDCHSAWAQEPTSAAHAWDGQPRSHPVGGVLPATVEFRNGVPLDATGVAQSTGDGNVFNDLRLDAEGRVQCWSCHGAHYAPANSAAVMP